MKVIGLIGNPNCGKTTIFNALTGSKQHIGNWPGVTVEKKEGFATLQIKGKVTGEGEDSLELRAKSLEPQQPESGKACRPAAASAAPEQAAVISRTRAAPAAHAQPSPLLEPSPAPAAHAQPSPLLEPSPAPAAHAQPSPLLEPSPLDVKIVDLPGVYSLTATSEDERATLEYVLSHEADLYVNVLDATTLERNLYLTLLMCELEVPMIVVVTMMDIARQRNMDIELNHLAEHLGVPVIGVNANNPLDIRKLTSLLSSAFSSIATSNTEPGHTNSKTRKLENSKTDENCTLHTAHCTFSSSSPSPGTFPSFLLPKVKLDYGNELEQEIDILTSCTVKTAQALKVSQRWVAIKALEGEPLVTKALIDYHDMAPELIEGTIERVTNILADPPDIELAEARYGIIAGLVKDVVHIRKSKMYFSEIIDRFVLNRFLGLPLFFLIMGLVFGLVSLAGGKPTEFFEAIGTWGLVHMPGSLLSACHAPDWLITIISGGLGSALVVLFTFVPVIFCMFLALAILEDSGYMARAAFLADRFMRMLGLPGKSFVPLLVGFGCSVPAIMSTRILESKRDRMLTIFMIPFMSCGAKLPVYAAFAVAFSPNAPWKMMFALYLVGIVLGTISGLVLKRTLFRGEPAHFIMELPPYHMPRPKHILLHTWERLTGFLWRAGKFIVPMMLVLGILNNFTVKFKPIYDGRVEASENSMLSAVGGTLTPVFEPIGVEKDNWPASVAVFTGLFAKESVIGTLNGLYGQDMEMQREGHVPEEKKMDAVMRSHFSKGFHQAFSYLLFILLYVPCVGATAVVFKEIGKLYGAIFVCYLTALGWSVATIYHSVMVTHSPLWFSIGTAIIAAMFTFFALYGKKHRVDMV